MEIYCKRANILWKVISPDDGERNSIFPKNYPNVRRENIPTRGKANERMKVPHMGISQAYVAL